MIVDDLTDDVMADLADHFTITATSTGDGYISFMVETHDLDQRFAGRSFRLMIASSNILLMKFPAELPKPTRRFGPGRVTLASLRRHADFDVLLTNEDRTMKAKITPHRLVGDMFDAVAITSREDFLVRVQNNHTKFASPDVLTIGAKSFYHRTEDLELRAACLTIMFHRLIWKPEVMSEADIAFCRWLIAEARVVLRACRRRLKEGPPEWAIVRWTVSLATVAGHGSVIIGRADRARDFYGIAGGQVGNLKISPVSGLNVLNGCFFSGLLAAVAGDMDVAKRQLESAVRGLRNMVNSQDLLANIWVTGDVLDAGRTSRQALIALVRLKLISNPNEPMIGKTNQLDIKSVKSPVGKFVDAGFCGETWNKLESMLDRDIIQ